MMQGNGDFHIVSNISVITRGLQQLQGEFISFLRNNLPSYVHSSLEAPESNRKNFAPIKTNRYTARN